MWIGFSVPAGAPQPSVIVQFDSTFHTPLFTVQVEPWNAGERLAARERQFTQATNRLLAAGFKPDARMHRWWAKPHEQGQWLHEADLTDTLARILEDDLVAIVQSGVLKGELDAAADRDAWRKAKRQRR